MVLCCLLPSLLAAARSGEADEHYEQAIRMHGKVPEEELFMLYARAAELGHEAAQYNVAMMYSNGESVNVDYQQAAYWFSKSAAQNFPPAQFRLGEMYFFGKGGLQEDRAMARRLFEAAAEQGDADAQMNLAILLASGDESSRSVEQARHWMNQADQGGHGAVAEWRSELAANGDNGLTEEQSKRYWSGQQQYWIEGAAEYGVREAQEALEAQKEQR